MRAVTWAALAAGCAAPATTPAPMQAPDFRPVQVRQPALVVRVAFGDGDFSDRERAALPGEYEGALLEALNARALLARDVSVVKELPEPPAALARGREVAADHVILVDVRIERGGLVFCRGERRPFQATVTAWRQSATVLRTSDGARRLVIEDARPDVTDLEEDCDDPRQSRRRSAEETIAEAINRLLKRLLAS